ncbi:hypothetical protein BJX63DRAFT_400941 [Aspergillus granulosus]|uniref:Uncharacterized protein n=1 Tax=Aspergillus granulosus TaxID=176169 RepID=A0ABR4H5R1_9EURO
MFLKALVSQIGKDWQDIDKTHIGKLFGGNCWPWMILRCGWNPVVTAQISICYYRKRGDRTQT